MTIEKIWQLMNDNPRTVHGYAQPVRDAVVAYARHRREKGATWSEIEAEVGVSRPSIRGWMTAPAGFHQVVIVDEPEPIEPSPVEPLAITSPSGFVLTGLDLHQAVTLLRSLG